MSARQPFFPGKSSSNTPPAPALPSSDASESMFKPDLANPLHATQNENVVPPLNTSSLHKANRNSLGSRRQSVVQQRPGTSDPHTGSYGHGAMATMGITRPGTSDPQRGNHRLQAHVQGHGIVAPTPRKTVPASPFAFKVPGPRNHNQQQQPQPDHSEESMYAPDIDRLTAPSPMRLAVLPSQPGPHRISFAHPIDVDDGEGEGDGYELAGPQTGSKRTRGDLEDGEDVQNEDEDGQQHPQKRFKPVPERAYSRNDHEYQPEQFHQRQQRPPQYHPNPSPPQAPAPMLRLLALLKADTLMTNDVVFESKIQRYERSCQRWKECSREEWLAGADEVIAKFTTLLDKVKDHMAEKLVLFTNCTAAIAAHTEVLKEREEVLASAKVQLVAGGGEVLAGHKGSP
ncbi:ECM11 domain-containing protein [Mycena chlorophos]|uniref:ECM11 domain-containing protein n=1 Tax=Mycena chlorophos TaxID=658473 RepID=A0A8H6SK64_MYCCL|nr:ECM11 domain-containing protein [Mycena chlorophos]